MLPPRVIQYIAHVLLPPLETATKLLAVGFYAIEDTTGGELWRVALTVCIGVFITLVSVIYRDMMRRQHNAEEDLKRLREHIDIYHTESLKRMDRASMLQFRAFNIMLAATRDNPDVTAKLTELLNSFYEENV